MSDRSDVSRSKPKSLPVDLDYIPDELRERAKVELFEDEDTRLRSLEELRTMLKKEGDLRWQDDDIFLLAFLRARKYDVKRAFSLIKGLYSCLGKHGHLYYNINLEYLRRFMEMNSQYVFPYRDANGSVVYCMRNSTWDPNLFSLEECWVVFTLGILQALRSPSTHIAGFHFILDFKDMSAKQMLYSSKPSDLKFFADILHNSVPVRVRGIHLLNLSSYAYYIYNIASYFLSKKVRERVHIHASDMKSLHQFFHPSILPADYGGELPKFDNKDWRQRMEASGDYIERVLSFGYEKYLKKDWKTGNSK